MNHLYLVRHGENAANLTLEFSHRKVDYSLTPKGVLQAQQTADFFRDKAIDEIYSSPLKRALETAEIIAAPLDLPVIVMENFREINVGSLEGQKPTAALWAQHNAILADWADGHPETCFPDGENYLTLQGRLQAGLAEILPGKVGKRIIIVGHGGIFNYSIRFLCSGVERTVFEKPMANCAITEILAEAENGAMKAQLLAFATAAHLSGEAAQLVLGYPKAGDLEE